MSKYFLDTEFHEYKKKPLFGKPIDTIELISIGIVAEDTYECGQLRSTGKDGYKTIPGREYYAICKDFDVKAAWDSFQWKEIKYFAGISELTPKDGMMSKKVKEYWLRENVLKPILKDLWKRSEVMSRLLLSDKEFEEVWKTKPKACRGWLITLLKQFGKSHEVIAEEIKTFVLNPKEFHSFEPTKTGANTKFVVDGSTLPIEFYAYYADYDWVCLSWLYGRMIDLPKGFPWYCKDLQQTKDEANGLQRERCYYDPLRNRCHKVELLPGYPKQTNEHNALADARWNKELYNFLQAI